MADAIAKRNRYKESDKIKNIRQAKGGLYSPTKEDENKWNEANRKYMEIKRKEEEKQRLKKQQYLKSKKD